MMRQDPDVLMVGEIRDRDAAAAVIEAALTGHKVFSTFHTDDTIGALVRLMEMGIEPFLISSTVVAVMSQRLVRLLCTACRKPHAPPPELLAAFEINSDGIEEFSFFQAHGCSACKGMGYLGRTSIHELLAINDAIRRCIHGRKASGEIRHIARNEAGLISMREDGFYKATKGITSLQEILRVVFHSERDQSLLRSARDVVGMCEGRQAVLTA
jgi:type IV pilus assembly protein PilB